MAYLRYSTGGETGEYPLADEPVSVGRSRDADIRLRGDARISHIHCYIESRKSGYWVKDNGSKNGTMVNGKKLQSHETLLTDGDEVMVGNTHIRFYDQDSQGGILSKIGSLFKKS